MSLNFLSDFILLLNSIFKSKLNPSAPPSGKVIASSNLDPLYVLLPYFIVVELNKLVSLSGLYVGTLAVL